MPARKIGGASVTGEADGSTVVLCKLDDIQIRAESIRIDKHRHDPLPRITRF
jgi:hypothetical protein